MKSIFEELYDMNYSPEDELYKNLQEEYYKLLDELIENKDRLHKYFNENKLYEFDTIFKRFVDLQISSAVIVAKERFIAGFKMSVKLMKEIS